jgi:UMF1 family MFS transporter
VYTFISTAGFFMRTATHFYILAFLVGTVQGGTQALSRSLYGAMVPKSQSAEFFGFFSTSSKFAGIVGPLLFGVVSQLAGGSRLSILSLIIFFVVGAFLLTRVDEQEGIRVAREEDAALTASEA